VVCARAAPAGWLTSRGWPPPGLPVRTRGLVAVPSLHRWAIRLMIGLAPEHPYRSSTTVPSGSFAAMIAMFRLR